MVQTMARFDWGQAKNTPEIRIATASSLAGKPLDPGPNDLDWLVTCYGETNAKLARQLI